MRYFNHVGFSINVPMVDIESHGKGTCEEDGFESTDHVARLLNTANGFFTCGMRFVYFSFPCIFWFFDPLLMMLATVVLIASLHYGDASSL
jgi:uncharacterized membrane protein